MAPPPPVVVTTRTRASAANGGRRPSTSGGSSSNVSMLSTRMMPWARKKALAAASDPARRRYGSRQRSAGLGSAELVGDDRLAAAPARGRGLGEQIRAADRFKEKQDSVGLGIVGEHQCDFAGGEVGFVAHADEFGEAETAAAAREISVPMTRRNAKQATTAAESSAPPARR